MYPLVLYTPWPTAHKNDLPLFICKVSAGFPSPASDYEQKPLNLHDFAVDDNDTTYFVEAIGDSMTKAGIYPGTMLVVDKSIEAQDGDIVVAWYDGGCTVKRLCISKDKTQLCPESDNSLNKSIEITNLDDCYILGVVISWHHTVIPKSERRRRKR